LRDLRERGSDLVELPRVVGGMGTLARCVHFERASPAVVQTVGFTFVRGPVSDGRCVASETASGTAP